jgi:hypothetical protein
VAAVIVWLATLALFISALAVMAAIADWLGEPERWDARRRNR